VFQGVVGHLISANKKEMKNYAVYEALNLSTTEEEEEEGRVEVRERGIWQGRARQLPKKRGKEGTQKQKLTKLETARKRGWKRLLHKS